LTKYIICDILANKVNIALGYHPKRTVEKHPLNLMRLIPTKEKQIIVNFRFAVFSADFFVFIIDFTSIKGVFSCGKQN